MKPTLWCSDGAWMCGVLDFTLTPPKDTEEYIKWACDGAVHYGITI